MYVFFIWDSLHSYFPGMTVYQNELTDGWRWRGNIYIGNDAAQADIIIVNGSTERPLS
jgi:hypothetical protein